jgi:carbonic anhydrase
MSICYSHNVVACLDSRCDPYKILSLAPSDAIVIRNPGGRVWSALADILILDSRFPLKQIILLQHNDCGTSHVTEELVDARVATAVKPYDPDTVKMMNGVCVFNISRGEVSVKEDLELLRRQSFLRRELVEKTTGFWLDTFSGIVKVVSDDY